MTSDSDEWRKIRIPIRHNMHPINENTKGNWYNSLKIKFYWNKDEMSVLEECFHQYQLLRTWRGSDGIFQIKAENKISNKSIFCSA